MEPIATFSGLASGIDFRQLTDQIIAAESRPILLDQQKIAGLQSESAAWTQFEGLVSGLDASLAKLADGTAFNTFKTSISGLPSGETAPLSVSAASDATPGSYTVKVLQTARAEKLGSDIFASRDKALGFSGEFLVNGRAVSVAATDSLDDIAAALNAANAGTNASGASASVIETAPGSFRLVLTSAETGAAGINLSDGTQGVLRSLGFLDTTTSLKNATSDGARSDAFTSSTTTLNTLLGFTTPPAAAAVTIGTGATQFNVTIDLATQSLQDVADAINTQAGLAGSSVTAQVTTETNADGATVRRLDISGTTSFTDANRILESLGVLAGGRGSVAQSVQGNAFTDGDAVTTATGSTLLTDLFLNGSSAGVQVGDTLTLNGTRADGTTFTKTFTVGASDTLQTLADSLNSAVDGFKVGTATATASIVGGRLVVTDDAGGDSQLALSITANNEGGGTLDFGTFAVATAGRNREILSGRDAQLQVDGSFVTRASNEITDVVKGVTFSLTGTSASEIVVDVSRDVSSITNDVQAMVDAYNALQDFVGNQFSGLGAEEGETIPPLAGDSTLRQMRNSIRDALRSVISAGVTGNLTRLADVGIEIDRDGRFTFDSAVFQTKLQEDPAAVSRLFSVYGGGSVNSLEFVSSSDATQAGTYDINITQAAARASVTGVGFGGTYVDDGTADTMTVTDLGSGSTYQISLSNGMTLAQIVDALNTQFQTNTQHQLETSTAVFSDALGTAATDATTLDSLFDSGGTNLGVANGDVITISGTTKDGTSIFREFTITDVTTQTLGDIRSEVETALGGSATVSVVGGKLQVTANETGLSLISLTIGSDNAGGGTLSFGTVDTTVAGRTAAAITASDSGGQLKLEHADYGSAAGFTVGYTAGGSDGSASLGLSAGTTTGLDVQGTIGGLAATGSGQLLQGTTGTAAEGLIIRVDSADTGLLGTFTFSRGVASLAELVTENLLGTDVGSIQDVVDGLDESIQRIEDRIADFEDRLERRRQSLLARFTALEEALARAQSQGQFLTSALAGLQTG
ncbi:MAG: hypothetical protein D6701_14400 [Gemmatimonadetes bacterium]|nr:MAG: hypothetical protein D6701_14400 [Gemmatimonadota bacterium]